MSLSLAGAPVSFGVFELTPADADTLTADEIAEILAETGYQGIDLGPVGFLGRGASLRDRLSRHHLDLAGGWVELPLSDDDAFEIALDALNEIVQVFTDAVTDATLRLPKPTLADTGSPQRKAHPGSGAPGLDDAGWDRLVTNLNRAAERFRSAGFEPTFHHHAGTFIETPDEIERLLQSTDIGLTLDTGHLLIGGGDPLTAVTRWGGRINHVHVKDVNRAELNRVRAAGGGMVDIWSSGAFVPLGHGDLPFAQTVDALLACGYDGWIVVEQDVLLAPDAPLGEFREARIRDHIINRDALRSWC